MALLVLGPILAFGLASCSLALGLGEDQCEVAGDCAKRGFKEAACVSHVCVSNAGQTTASSSGSGTGGAGGSDPAWACLPGFVTPTATDMLPVSFQIVRADGQALPSDLQITLCSSFDASCTTPIESNVTLDSNGMHTFMVSPTFGNGFLEINSPSMATFPSLAFFNSPVIIPPATKIIRLTTQAEFESLLTLTKLSSDPDHGIALILTSDCQDVRTAGVTLSSKNTDSMTTQFYFEGNLPVPTDTQTDAEGAAGFLNLPVGVAKIDATRHDTGEFIGEASFQVRKQVITYVSIGPTTQP